ncbi:hypothetical protein HXX76_001908 [Chlamydomonas incerta]|uniref:Uncharacterized protein n=1 Tax=Chlamydomonas incerta TaxID=51695 RepID=A0A836B001_CHLIN|nr:hypothetical protein HXX76_001908 [Chlamydomonas incerta]|eukprot:KAG2443556.1 hypothetical protein HXX76_001908 [Chlamydomonas incerta]
MRELTTQGLAAAQGGNARSLPIPLDASTGRALSSRAGVLGGRIGGVRLRRQLGVEAAVLPPPGYPILAPCIDGITSACPDRSTYCNYNMFSGMHGILLPVPYVVFGGLSLLTRTDAYLSAAGVNATATCIRAANPAVDPLAFLLSALGTLVAGDPVVWPSCDVPIPIELLVPSCPAPYKSFFTTRPDSINGLRTSCAHAGNATAAAEVCDPDPACFGYDSLGCTFMGYESVGIPKAGVCSYPKKPSVCPNIPGYTATADTQYTAAPINCTGPGTLPDVDAKTQCEGSVACRGFVVDPNVAGRGCTLNEVSFRVSKLRSTCVYAKQSCEDVPGYTVTPDVDYEAETFIAGTNCTNNFPAAKAACDAHAHCAGVTSKGCLVSDEYNLEPRPTGYQVPKPSMCWYSKV